MLRGYVMAAQTSYFMFFLLSCRALVTSSSHCCVYAACSSFTRYNIHFAFIIFKA